MVFTYDCDDRLEVTWGNGDQIAGGPVQSNGRFVVSDYGCPVFQETVWFSYGQYVDMGSCNPDQVFLGDPDTLMVPPFVFPTSGNQTFIDSADIILDATAKLLWDGMLQRDTLIMTELEFLDDGFQAKQWWFLKPPHIKEMPSGFFFVPPNYLDFSEYPGGAMENCTDVGNNGSTGDLRTCAPYIDSLFFYHAIGVELDGNSWVNEYSIRPTVGGPHGFSHYDFWPIDLDGNPDPDNLLLDEFISCQDPTVIYVQGGPVHVKGTYAGQYTIVTDEFVTYHRHAWPTPHQFHGYPPIDTVWCNIWLTDDLVNSDSEDPPAGPPQPDENCMDGSTNSMGLVSGANIIIANTPANGAADSWMDSDIVIHAAVIALNESFVSHYWQNNILLNSGLYANPPWGDGRGISIYYPNLASDFRGYVYLWGSIIQKYRGFMLRNSPGPYSGCEIGYHKNYHYDLNLNCNPPPHFPDVEYVYPFFGDLNHDTFLDVSDILMMINIVLGWISEETMLEEQWHMFSDMNKDGAVDILDIVVLVDVILMQ